MGSTLRSAIFVATTATFDEAHATVHYPPDRGLRIWIRPSFLIAAIGLVLLPVLAWIELLLFGLPHIPPVPQIVRSGYARPQWLSAMGALLPLLQLCLLDDADPERSLDAIGLLWLCCLRADHGRHSACQYAPRDRWSNSTGRRSRALGYGRIHGSVSGELSAGGGDYSHCFAWWSSFRAKAPF